MPQSYIDITIQNLTEYNPHCTNYIFQLSL